MSNYVERIAELREESVEEAWDEMCYSTEAWAEETYYY